MKKKEIKNNAPSRIYLDYAATTPIDAAVLKKMLPYFDGRLSNPSSMHSSGRRAKQAISKMRLQVADILGASPDEIIFTGSGTEADNLAIKGVAQAHVRHGKHIIISAIEHKAVTESAKQLEKQGFTVSVIPVDRYGVIDVKKCISMITPETTLVSVMYANNEIGTIEPIRELGIAIRKWQIAHGNSQYPFFHTDACQAAGFLSVDVHELGVDLMTINSSKIYGPKGVGLLYKKKGITIEPLVIGGEQEYNIRAGTENIALIVGFGEALIDANARKEIESQRLTELRDYFIDELLKKIKGAVVNGHRTLRLPNNIHVSIPYIEGESILLMLDMLGIEASTGSACSAYDLKPSHVLLAIGQTPEFVHGSLRFSLGRTTTKNDLDRVVAALAPIVHTLSSTSALTAKLSHV
ncbi:MAG: cysteine desulfurase family protein [bacterium]